MRDDIHPPSVAVGVALFLLVAVPFWGPLLVELVMEERKVRP